MTLWLLAVLATVWHYRALLVSLWREPVLRRPVLILESDDWGPGPAHHAERLGALRRLLGTFTDNRGRCPVMTLGVVLAMPDRERLRDNDATEYARLTLADPRFSGILIAMGEGAREGVFSLQLHGLEHYWPPAILAAAAGEPRVREWLIGTEDLPTEALPPPLQARWVDAARLPSSPLDPEAIERAAGEEARVFAEVLGQPAEVVVPPTFVWNPCVERAWANAGVKVVVTPGRRHAGRDAEGALISERRAIRNGARGAGGVVYVVRDDYFEPMLGHRAERGLRAAETKCRLGRPTLLETHRANFVGDEASSRRAVQELRRLLELVRKKLPDTQFMSTGELARRMIEGDRDLVETRTLCRLHVWLERVAAIDRLRKLAALTGLLVPGWLLHLMTRPASPAPLGRG